MGGMNYSPMNEIDSENQGRKKVGDPGNWIVALVSDSWTTQSPSSSNSDAKTSSCEDLIRLKTRCTEMTNGK